MTTEVNKFCPKVAFNQRDGCNCGGEACLTIKEQKKAGTKLVFKEHPNLANGIWRLLCGLYGFDPESRAISLSPYDLGLKIRLGNKITIQYSLSDLIDFLEQNGYRVERSKQQIRILRPF